MKQNTHPNYHEIKVIMTDSTEFTTRSTWGKPGDVMRLDIDPKTHPAWTGQNKMVDRGGQLTKFNKRFAGITDTAQGAAKVALANAGPTTAKPKAEKPVAEKAGAAKGKK